MARLIDANSILDDFLKRYTGMEKDGKLVFAACEIKQDFADMISNATTVDAAPVRHGRWELVEYQCTPLDTDQTLVCTECGFAHQNDDWYNYCPNCGAKMDEVSE